MSNNPDKPGKPSEADAGRREFLKKGGAALASGVALSSLPALAGAGGSGGEGASREEESVAERVTRHSWHRPNLLILITDQERYPQHWPEGWADANMPNRKRIADQGLTFTHAFCASAMCTPSRATLFTGVYPPEHHVDQTLRYGTTHGAPDQPTLPLPPTQENMASMLEAAGYDVQYRGKWHISKDPSGATEISSRQHLERYGFKGWEPPEGGGDQSPSGFGGGTTDYDSWYTQQAVDFLRSAKAGSKRPFALIVCLINPHDVMAYPGIPVEDGGTGGWDSRSLSDIDPYKESYNYRGVDFYSPPLDQIELPQNTDPEGSKPTAQAESTEFWSALLGPLDTPQTRLEYVRFFAHLHTVSDGHFGTILDALEALPHLHRNTLVIRLADHGEMGLSHGGMRQKAYNAYEETIHVPLVISNPKLFPRPVRTAALASLVDLMPTLATIAEVPGRGNYTFRGTDLTPVILDAIRNPSDPSYPGQDSVLFTTDETLGSLLTDGQGNPIVKEPSHIRALREERWKVVMYFDPEHVQDSQYELYDLQADPLERTNLASSNPEKLSEMIAKLEIRMAQTHTTPP